VEGRGHFISLLASRNTYVTFIISSINKLCNLTLAFSWRGQNLSHVGIQGFDLCEICLSKHRSSLIDAIFKTVQRHPSKTLNFFYCKNEEEDRNTSSSIFRTFLHQLLSPLPLNPNPIEEFYEKQKLKGFTHEAIDFEDSLQLYLSSTSNRSTIYIIIDALDECAPEDRRELLASLVRLLLRPEMWVKIFITSRDANDISFVLSKYPNLSIRASHNRGDLSAFLDDEIDRRVRDGRLLRGNVNLGVRQQVKDHLIEKAQGMYVLADVNPKCVLS
jgi:hypothetical protein